MRVSDSRLKIMDRDTIRWVFFLAALLVPVGCARKLPPVVSVDNSTLAAARTALEEGVASAGAAGPVTLAKPTGWGTLFGKFTLNGAAPPPSPLTVDKDVSVCAPGGKQMLDEGVVVGPGNGLQNVLIYVSSPIPVDDPAWIHESYAAASGERIFDQKNCRFLTHVMAMRSNEHLKVLNSDSVGHNTNFASKRGAKAQDVLIPGGGAASYEPGAASPAPFGVSCAIHPWMKAWMMVCDSPYFAVTKEDGAFEIANMPAGVELELRVWQEKVTFVSTATVNGAPAKWSKGKFKLNLNPDERREMNAVIDATSLQ